MSDFQIVQAVTLEVRRQIYNVLNTAPGVNFGLQNEDRISLAPPDATHSNNTVASLYLYHLGIDPHLRNQRPLPDVTEDGLFHQPPLPLRLRYLLTPLESDDGDNQVVLGLVLQHLHDNPALHAVDGVPLTDSHGAVPARIKVRFDPLPMDAQTNLWNAFSTAMRLAITLQVEVVAIDSARAPSATPRVDQTITAPGIKQRETVNG